MLIKHIYPICRHGRWEGNQVCISPRDPDAWEWPGQAKFFFQKLGVKEYKKVNVKFRAGKETYQTRHLEEIWCK